MNADNFFLVGINHLSTSISCRERTSIPPDRLSETMRLLLNAAGLEEAAVLSTCSRLEILAAAEQPEAAADHIRSWLIKRVGPQAAPGIYIKKGEEAVRHLFRVAAGLDSWIIGESEIQGQVKKAYRAALEQGLTGRILNQVFQQALGAGKSIRSETGIQNGIRSIGGAAALLAKKIFSDMERGKVVVFGAGEVAEAVVRHLTAKDFKEIWVANRTLERAQVLAGVLNGKALTVDEGIARLAEAEAAVFSTSCPKVLLEASPLERILVGRKRPLFLIDLGMPRNIDPACSGIAGVYLYDLDDLKRIVEVSMASKAVEKDQAEVLAGLAASECVARLTKSEAILTGPAFLSERGGGNVAFKAR